MGLTRRGFIRHTLALGPVAASIWIESDQGWAQADPECTLPANPGDAGQFVPAEPNMLTRYSAREMADPGKAAQLANFRAAIHTVRNLPDTNVNSWTKQIAQHCINCARSFPNNIHYSWDFLPWHRALLYFMERILRKESGHDDLRLPYWDWENPLSRDVPAIYAAPNQPLFWENRHFNSPLDDSEVDVETVFAMKDFRRFGGTAAQRQPTPGAFSGPHADVHNHFAASDNGPFGDMSDLQYSPRDPIFYAHHGNIDRMWSSWTAAGNANPKFGDQAKVYFYDENRKWRFVKMDDLKDEKKLGYQYSSLMKTPAPAHPLRTFVMTGTNTKFSLGADAMASVAMPEGSRYLIVENIKNLDNFPATALRYGIFAKKPAVGTDSKSNAAYLGKASRVRSSGHDHLAPLTAAMNVTSRFAAQLNKGTISLYVAPLDATGTTTAASIPLAADSVTLVD